MQVKLILRLENVTENVTEQSADKQADADKNVTEYVTDNENKSADKILKKLSPRQRAIIRIIHAQPKVTVDELSERVIVNRRTILRDIKSLQQCGILRREGPDFGGRWVVTYDKE